MNKRTRGGVNWWLACGVVVGGVVILGVLAGIYYWFIPASGPVPSVQILQPAQALEIESGQAVVVVARGESNNGIQRIDFFVDDIPVNQQLSGQPQQASLDAVQIHGGYGFTTEFEVERDLRDSIASTIYSGTSEMQRNIIARLIGL